MGGPTALCPVSTQNIRRKSSSHSPSSVTYLKMKVFCAVNVQQIIHFRTSGCVIKLVSLLREMLEIRTRLPVLAVLMKCGKLVSPFTVYSIK
jgi:mRNA-degrading endonuclease toxin of MazEF toxin-antitoxin module